MYQSTPLKYHEIVQDWDVEDNYDPNILEWVDVNYQIMSMYDDAHVKVFEEALDFKWTIEAEESK